MRRKLIVDEAHVGIDVLLRGDVFMPVLVEKLIFEASELHGEEKKYEI